VCPLVVEDNAVPRDSVVDVLELSGFEAVT
jgi:hypothetical protein